MQRKRTHLTHDQDTKKQSIASAFECAQTSGLLEKHFKSVIINEYKELQKNKVLMSEQIQNLDSEMETIKKKQLEI